MGQHNNRLGAAGETAAARWYRRRGYRVIDRNWRWGGHGEIDLVLRRGTMVVFCEVKTRSSTRFGVPAAAVDADKQRRIRRLARHWLDEHPVRAGVVRFDVASVLRGHVSVIEAAF
ncbi:MAG: YraN family protein [Acidimicrobiia bacterium]|nr:YraN family protein [Acidimicrobiia bacterium]MDH5236646.1 YraN family protein [Acidimicrobiia bacterium]